MRYLLVGMLITVTLLLFGYAVVTTYNRISNDITTMLKPIEDMRSENMTVLSVTTDMVIWKDTKGTIHSGFIADGKLYEMEVK